MPLLAALVPVWRGVRVTVREAVSTTGIADAFGRSRFDRPSSATARPLAPHAALDPQHVPAQGRLALTLSALTWAAAVFMAVFTVRSSLYQTLDDTLAYFDYDVQVELSRAERVRRADPETMDGARASTAAETWRFATIQRIRADGTESRSFITFGLPPNARSVRPTVQEGRWLVPEDGNALVATANVREDEPDLRVGRPGHAAGRRPGRDLDARRDRRVAHPAAVPVHANAGPLEQATHEVGRAGGPDGHRRAAG